MENELENKEVGQENVVDAIDEKALMDDYADPIDNVFVPPVDNKTTEEAKAPVEPLVPEKKEAASDSTVDEYWSTLKESLGEDFELPEIITKGVNEKGEKLSPKEKVMILRDTLFDNTILGKTEDDDAFVRNYLYASSQEGFDRKQWLQSLNTQQTIMDLPPDRFMFEVYKQEMGLSDQNPDGLSDDDLMAYIQKKDPIELKIESNKRKAQYRQYEEQRASQEQKIYEERFVNSYNEAEKTNSEYINNYLEKTKGFNNIDGIELGEADMQQFRKDLPDFFKRKIVEIDGKKVAYSEAEQLLSEITTNPEKSVALLPLLWMIKNNKLKGYSSMLKEQTKKNIEAKFDRYVAEDKGQSFSVNNGQIDESALYE